MSAAAWATSAGVTAMTPACTAACCPVCSVTPPHHSADSPRMEIKNYNSVPQDDDDGAEIAQ